MIFPVYFFPENRIIFAQMIIPQTVTYDILLLSVYGL